MTTVVDPGGTPAPSYNRSGNTIQSVNAAGSSSGTALQLTHYSEWDVFLVTRPDDADYGVMLPTNPDIGDVVEIHPVNEGITVYAPSGFYIDGSSGTEVEVPPGSLTMRLVDSATWRGIASYQA